MCLIVSWLAHSRSIIKDFEQNTLNISVFSLLDAVAFDHYKYTSPIQQAVEKLLAE